MPSPYRLYGSVLSPFSLKVEALLRHARLPLQFLPGDGPTRAATHAQVLQQAVLRGVRAPTYPPLGPLRELPLVPYVFTDRGEVLWDSTAIARWLENHPGRLLAPAGLFPGDPATRFAADVVDELFDEVGLYVLHHVRWVMSGATTRAMDVLADEYSTLLPGPLCRLATRGFAERQVRRLPYLFSVAPEGQRFEGISSALQPPARRGFPPTHALLDELFDAFLDASEQALATAPFLFGERFTLADASLYGMMASIRRLDPAGASRLRDRAPTLRAWLDRVGREATPREGTLCLRPGLSPLLSLAGDALLPLLDQNAAAFDRAAASGGAPRRAERAFDAEQALYDGTLRGHPYRSVAKGFQVGVRRRLVYEARALSAEDGGALRRVAPGLSEWAGSA